MSVLGVLFLLCFLLFLLYMVYGSILRYRKGIRCFPMVLPHYLLWCRLGHYILYIISCGRVQWWYRPTGDMDIPRDWEWDEGVRGERGLDFVEDEKERVNGFPVDRRSGDGNGDPYSAVSHSAPPLLGTVRNTSSTPSSSTHRQYGPPGASHKSEEGGAKNVERKVTVVRGVVASSTTGVVNPTTTRSEVPPLSSSPPIGSSMNSRDGHHTSMAPENAEQKAHTSVIEEVNEDFEMEAEMNPSEIVVVY